MHTDAAAWIERLQLSPHPEGGFFRETYRSQERVRVDALPSRYDGSRSLATSIYFLLAGGDFSAFHRLKSDEIWHFYAGAGLAVFLISPEGCLTVHRMGSDPRLGHVPQVTVPAGSWLAAAPSDGTSYALTGCTVSPGFDFLDFELADRDELIARFPDHRILIESMTRVPRPGIGDEE